jgi:hypothetical protein
MRLYESECAGDRVHCVRVARAWWDDLNDRIAGDDPQIKVFATQLEAPKQYADCRASRSDAIGSSPFSACLWVPIAMEAQEFSDSVVAPLQVSYLAQIHCGVAWSTPPAPLPALFSPAHRRHPGSL